MHLATSGCPFRDERMHLRRMNTLSFMGSFHRHRKGLAMWMIVLWALLIAGTALAHCCHEASSMAHQSHAADVVDSDGAFGAHDEHPHGAALECPEWIAIAAVTPDAAVAGALADGHSAVPPVARPLRVASVSVPSFPRHYFVSLPPRRSYLRFCRFLE